MTWRPWRQGCQIGLRARLLGLVALSTLPALGFIVLLNVELRREHTAEAHAEAMRAVRLGVGEQSRQVEAARRLLVHVSQIPEAWTPDEDGCDGAVRELAHKLPMYSGLGVARLDGEVACSSFWLPRRLTFADREWFQRAITARRSMVAGISAGRVNGGQPVIVIGLPLVDQGGVHAVAFAGLRLDWLARFAREAQLGRDATVEVVDAHGTVLARDPARRDGADASLGGADIAALVAAGQGMTERRDADGVDRLYAFAPLVPGEDSPGIYLQVGLPRARLFAAANRQLGRNVLLFAVAAALAFGAAWVGGTRFIMNAVHGLGVAARRVRDGDLTTRVRLSDDYGELSELAHAFDDMARALEERELDLALAAAAQRAAEARLSWATIAETSNDAIIGIDRDGTIFSWNAGAETLFGYAAGDVIGRPATTLVPVDRVPQAIAAATRVREGERVNDCEMPAVTRDGREVDASWTLSRIRDAGGKVLGTSAIARDINERRRADARLRIQSAALEAAANGIVITDAEGTIEWVNAAFTTITGYGADEAVGRTPRILKSGAHPDALYAELWQTVCAGRVWRGRLVNRRKDGTLYDEEETITPVLDERGAVAHFVAVKQDVTAERRAEEALRRSEEHFRSLIENALDIILVLDAEGVIRYASPSVERVFGDRPDAVVGQPGFAWIHPDDVDAIRRLFADGVRTPGFTASVEYRVRHTDGSWRTLEAIGRNLLDEDSIVGVVINARDITERKQAEALQANLQTQLAQTEKLAAMGNLLAGVAHELNNPLAVLIGHATLLESSAHGTAGAARAVKIHDAAQRCARIVKNFLALARQHAPERVRTDLRQVIRDTLEFMAYPLRVDGVEVVLDLADDAPFVAVDPHQIQQVLVNLITNAHHALREVASSRRLTIALRADAAARNVAITVSDTGPGMSAATEKRLFEPFFTTKPVGQGTGLGLSICKGIVESHGGRIAVDTAPGRGTAFTVALPLDTPVTDPPPPAPVERLRPCRILVVDDEPDVLSVLTDMLAADGHTVDGAASGPEALARLAAGAYDAIVSDIKMPGLDGPGLYREVLRRHPELSRRFMFVTGDTLNPATMQFLEEAKAVSVRKPFSPETARAALSQVVAAAVA